MKKILFVFALLLATCVPWAQALPPGPVDYLCFTADAANSTIELTKSGSSTAVTIQYQVNGTAEGGWGNGFYRASTTDAADKASNLGFKKSNN